MRKFKTSIFVVIVVGIGLGLFYFLGTPAPEVSLSRDAGPIAARKQLDLKLDAHGGILKKLSISAMQADKTVKVLAKVYPSGSHRAAETFDLARAGLQDGAFTLQVEATSSAQHFGADRTTTRIHSFALENKPPQVDVLSIANYVTQGGAGLVVYTVSKEVEKTGVEFADQFYQGYRQGGNFYACLFPFPYDMDPAKFVPKVIAIDRAGNERVTGIYYHLAPRPFQPTGSI